MSGNVHQDNADKLKATVVLAAGNVVEVTQDVAADLKATVTQAEKDRTVTNPTAANLKSEVSQGTAANLKGTAYIRSNTNKDGSGTDLAPLLDADGHQQVDVLSGGAAGTEYTEGDTDATITGPAALAEGDDDTLTPLQVDAAKNLKVNVVAGGAGGGVVTQPDPALLKATVTQAAKDRTVTNVDPAAFNVRAYQPLAAGFNATVAQAAKDRTVTNDIYANLKGQMKATDGTNFQAMMDVAARRGYVQLTNGTISPAIASEDDDIPGAAKGLVTLPLLYGFDPGGTVWRRIGGVYDSVTGRFSMATSRAAGKSTKSEEYNDDQTDVEFIVPEPGRRLQVVGVITSMDAETGDISLDFPVSEQKVWRHYGARFKTKDGMDMAFVGNPNEPLVLNSTQGANRIFILVNYREIG